MPRSCLLRFTLCLFNLLKVLTISVFPFNSVLNSLVVPSAGFTQRATIDPNKDEIHVLSVS